MLSTLLFAATVTVTGNHLPQCSFFADVNKGDALTQFVTQVTTFVCFINTCAKGLFAPFINIH